MATTTQLASIVTQLQKARQTHIDAIAKIDDEFAQFGVTPERPKRRGRKPGRPKGTTTKKKAKKKTAKKKARRVGRPKGKEKAGKKQSAKKRTRRSFSKTADQFVLDLLTGGKTMTTAQVNAKWKQARGTGNADNTLSKLTKDRKLKRTKVKVGMGSVYSAA